MQITTSSAAALPTPETLQSIGRRHQHVALGLTVLMLTAYFIFILSIAFSRMPCLYRLCLDFRLPFSLGSRRRVCSCSHIRLCHMG